MSTLPSVTLRVFSYPSGPVQCLPSDVSQIFQPFPASTRSPEATTRTGVGVRAAVRVGVARDVGGGTWGVTLAGGAATGDGAGGDGLGYVTATTAATAVAAATTDSAEKVAVRRRRSVRPARRRASSGTGLGVTPKASRANASRIRSTSASVSVSVSLSWAAAGPVSGSGAVSGVVIGGLRTSRGGCAARPGRVSRAS